MKKRGFSPYLIFLLAGLSGFALLEGNNSMPKNKLTLHAVKIKATKNQLPAPMVKNNVLPEKRNFTEEEITELSEDQFTELLKETKNKLPTLSDMKELPEDAIHHTPAVLVQAGQDLGLIKEILKVHESYERLATHFYKSCAKDEEGATAVRALCLTNFMEIKKKNNESLDLKEYPKRLVELSKMVTGI